MSWAQSRDEATAPAFWDVLQLPGLMAATVGTALLLVVAAACIDAGRPAPAVLERWHLVAPADVRRPYALSFLHQLAGPDLAGHRLLQIGWALIYVHVFALLVRHRVLAPMRQAARHSVRVVAVVPEAPGVVSIEVDGHHLRELEAEPGPFFRWRFLTPDHWLTAHPFSLSAAPTNDRLRLTVKALGRGSTDLQSVGVGTWVVAEGPVRRDDRRSAHPGRRAPHRRRCRHHSHAGPLRDTATGGRSGPHAPYALHHAGHACCSETSSTGSPTTVLPTCPTCWATTGTA